MSFSSKNSSQTENSTKKIEYLVLLKLLSNFHDNERCVIENLQKDYNDYIEATTMFQKNYTKLCELLCHSADRSQIQRSSRIVNELHSIQLTEAELQQSVNFLQTNSTFQKQQDFQCTTKDLPIVTTVDLVTTWHRENYAKGVSLNKLQNYAYRVKKATGRIHKVFTHANKRLRHSFTRLIELWVERFDQSFIRAID